MAVGICFATTIADGFDVVCYYSCVEVGFW